MQFRFDSEVSISVERKWEVRDATGSLVDGIKPNAQRDGFYVHVLLGKRLDGFSLDPPQLLLVAFRNWAHTDDLR